MKSTTAKAAKVFKGLDSLFRTVERRLFIRLHTFEPDAENIDRWIPRLVSWRRDQSDLMQTYAEIYSGQSGARWTETGSAKFYNAADALIRLARALQFGAIEESINLEHAVSTADRESRYASALARGHRDLITLGRYVQGEIDDEMLARGLAFS